MTEQTLEAGERILELQTIGGRGRASGVEVRQDGALLWTIRDGRVAEIEVFLDHREALTAAGLEEPSPAPAAGDRRGTP